MKLTEEQVKAIVEKIANREIETRVITCTTMNLRINAPCVFYLPDCSNVKAITVGNEHLIFDFDYTEVWQETERTLSFYNKNGTEDDDEMRLYFK